MMGHVVPESSRLEAKEHHSGDLEYNFDGS